MMIGVFEILIAVLVIIAIVLVYIQVKRQSFFGDADKPPAEIADFWSNRIGARYVPPVSEKDAARRVKIDPNVSPLDLIDDPAAAAVVMMLAIAKEKGPLTPGIEEVIRKELILSVGADDPEEILLFSKWAPLYAEDSDRVLQRFSSLWQAALTPEEQEAMVARIERVAQAEGGMTFTQANKIAALRSSLGLTTSDSVAVT